MRARRASRHMRGASTDVLCTIVGVRANDVWKGVKGWIWDMSRSAMSSCSRPTERLSRRVSLCACVGSGARVSPRYQRLDQKIWGQATGTDPRLIASVGRGRCVDARPHVVDGVEREGGGTWMPSVSRKRSSESNALRVVDRNVLWLGIMREQPLPDPEQQSRGRAHETRSGLTSEAHDELARNRAVGAESFRH
jgi:hypothetical protein